MNTDCTNIRTIHQRGGSRLASAMRWLSVAALAWTLAACGSQDVSQPPQGASATPAGDGEMGNGGGSSSGGQATGNGPTAPNDDAGQPDGKTGGSSWQGRSPSDKCPGGAGCECHVDSDCVSGHCIVDGGEKKCASKCPCPKGYDCKKVSNDDGSSDEICLPPPPPTCKPTAELCDGLDNDCNGLVDDDCTMPKCPLVASFNKTPAGHEIRAGEKLSTQYSPWHLTVHAVNNKVGHPDLAIAFDAENPTGGDSMRRRRRLHAQRLLLGQGLQGRQGEGLRRQQRLHQRQLQGRQVPA